MKSTNYYMEKLRKNEGLVLLIEGDKGMLIIHWDGKYLIFTMTDMTDVDGYTFTTNVKRILKREIRVMLDAARSKDTTILEIIPFA